MGEQPNGAALDLADPNLYGNGPPHGLWRDMRLRAPVEWNESNPVGFWAVTGIAEVRRVLRDTTTFASSTGNMLAVLGGIERGSGKMLAVTDGPHHGQLWRALAGLLNEASSGDFERMVSAAAARLSSGLADGEDAAAACREFAAEVTGELLGLPRESWQEAQLCTVAAVVADGDAAYGSAQAQLRSLQLLREVTLRPTGTSGVLTRMHREQVGGRSLDRDELLLNAYGLLLGASVTTGHALSRMLLAAAEAPETWTQMRSQPVSRETVEEVVRWTSPTAHFMRTTTRAVDLGDARLRQGDAVTVWLGAANRDPSVFADPDTLDPTRSPNPHVGFGAGAHFCAGAPVARLALRIALETLLLRFEGFRSAGHTWYRSNFLSGLRTLSLEAVPDSGPSR